MVDVFISYAREDQGVAQRIAEAVRREGYSVFWDHDLPPHLSYGEVIAEKIGSAKAAIVVWSAAAAASEWVRAEADLARSQKKLIQTSVDDRIPPMPFNQIQFASIGDWQSEADHPGWRKVRASLAALCGGDAEAAGTAPLQALSTGPVATAPSAPGTRRSAAPLIAAIAGGIVLVAAVGGFLWLRSGSDAADVAEVGGTAANQAAAVPSPAPRPATARFTQAAMIEDPDGYTNVRSGPGEGFAIVARVDRGDVFTTYPQTGEWWQVRTADSRVGFMSRSRIRVIVPGSTPDSGVAIGDDAQGPSGSAQPAAFGAGGADPPQVFADSSHRRLSPAELAGLSRAEIRIARNEIFARHGRPFQDARLRRHFERYSWYDPRPGQVTLNAIEQANVRLLQQAERK